MTGIVNKTGARSGVIGTTVGTPDVTSDPTARCKWVFGGGSTPTSSASKGFSSIADAGAGAGNVVFNFSTAMSNTTYTQIAGAIANSTASPYDPQTTTCNVLINNRAGTAYEDADGSIVIWAQDGNVDF